MPSNKKLSSRPGHWLARRRKTDSRFQAFADAAPAILWVSAPDGACTFLSKSWFDLTGLSETSSLGYGWMDAIHPDDREAARGIFAAAACRKEAFTTDYRLRSTDGFRWVLDTARPRFDTDGTFLGFVGSVIDITARKAAEERARRLNEELHGRAEELQALLDRLPVGIFIAHDRACRDVSMNPAGAAMFGIAHDARVSDPGTAGALAFHVFRPDCVEVTPEDLPMNRAARTGEPVSGDEVDVVRADGSVVSLFAYAVPLFDCERNVRGCVGVFVDLTENKRAERVVAEASRAKDQFLAMLGHELRNPLAPILTALELMRLREGADVSRERLVIERQVDHMVRLVDDLLDVSRITRGRLELRKERVELSDVVARAIETTSPVFEERNHDLVIDVPPAGLPIFGDPARLAQVVSNLLTNAAKYTNPGGRVTVTGALEKEQIVLRVRDTGVGIPPEILSHVFDLFVQGRQALDRSKGGLGLGLAIVRSLTELHEGTVSAHSEGPGRGTEITIRLPAAATRAANDDADRDTRAAGRSVSDARRVLVVDDNVDAAAMLAEYFEAIGHEVMVAHDAPAALALSERTDFDVAVVDIGLPVMDGYELARRLRAHPRQRSTRLVAVTGYGQDSDRRRSLAAGFDGHMVKPVDVDQLATFIADSTVKTAKSA